MVKWAYCVRTLYSICALYVFCFTFLLPSELPYEIFRLLSDFMSIYFSLVLPYEISRFVFGFLIFRFLRLSCIVEVFVVCDCTIMYMYLCYYCNAWIYLIPKNRAYRLAKSHLALLSGRLVHGVAASCHAHIARRCDTTHWRATERSEVRVCRSNGFGVGPYVPDSVGWTTN